MRPSKTWLLLTKDYKAEGQLSNLTLFSGGKFFVPEEMDNWEELYRAMADDIVNDTPIYCNRRVLTDTEDVKFRFFIDVDLKTTTAMSDDQLTKIAQTCHRTVMKYFPNLPQEDGFSIAMRNDAVQLDGVLPLPRQDNDDALQRALQAIREQSRQDASGRIWKQGLHLHWPTLVVTRDQALDMRMHCVESLRVAIMDTELHFPDVLDEGVYINPSLRMSGCAKCDAKCTACNGKGKIAELGRTYRCQCYNGRMHSGREYKPWLWLNHRGQIDATMTEHIQKVLMEKNLEIWTYIMQHTDIGAFDNPLTPSFVRPATAPGFNSVEALRQALRVRGKRNMASGLADDVRSGVPSTYTMIDRDSRIANILLQEIRKLAPEYAEVQISRVLLYQGEHRKSTYYIDVTGPGRSFCNNVGRSHNSNGVCFIATSEGISQKCYCQKDNMQESRTGVVCSKYRSESFPHTADALSELFQVGSLGIPNVTATGMAGLDISSAGMLEAQQRLLAAYFEEINPQTSDAFARIRAARAEFYATMGK